MKQNEWTKDGALKQKLISTRRTIHQHPSLSCHEEPTAAFIAKRLEELANRFRAAGDPRSAQEQEQLWEILVGAMEQMAGLLGETTL